MFRGFTKTNRVQGRMSRLMEESTSKLSKVPTDAFLWSALGAVAAALALHMSGKKEHANFVGQWAPTLLVLGLYTKVIKRFSRD